MSIAITLAAVIVVAIAALLLFASTKPDTFHVERSVLIQAAPEAIYPRINDLHQWDAWTPYNKDPAMKKTQSGNGNTTAATTRVTWSLDDKHKLLHKTMSIFLILDNMIGKDFAQGLAQLMTVVETTKA